MFVAELIGVYFTGGSLNPARSFGPALYNLSFPTYHWIYWAGPFIGAIVAAGFYHFIKFLEYETANPGQDEEDHEAYKEAKQAASEKRQSMDSRRLSKTPSRRSMRSESAAVPSSPPRPFASREHRGSVGSESTYAPRPQNGSLCTTCTNCGKTSYPWIVGRKDSRITEAATASNGYHPSTLADRPVSPSLTLHEGTFAPIGRVITYEEPRRYATNVNDMA